MSLIHGEKSFLLDFYTINLELFNFLNNSNRWPIDVMRMKRKMMVMVMMIMVFIIRINQVNGRIEGEWKEEGVEKEKDEKKF